MHVLAFGKVAKRDSINVKVLGRRGVGFGEGEGTFPQRKATFVLDVVWVVAFDEVG